MITTVLLVLALPVVASAFSAVVSPKIARPPLEGVHPDYPFENVVFQGGGARGTIYGGTAEALEDLGILPYLKRFAGASAGSFTALCMALGLDSKQIQEEMSDLDLTSFCDGGTGAEQMMNAVNHLGMHPATTLTDKMGDVLERYGGDSNMTFLDLYEDFGVELCILVSNLSRSESEFCHVNTTPNLPIKKAIRASMSFPILFQPTQVSEDPSSMYVDGGLYNNYPIKAFDGWYLSTKPGDSILTKSLEMNPQLQSGSVDPGEVIKTMQDTLAESYSLPNTATIGFRVSDSFDPDDLAYVSALESMLSQHSGDDEDLVEEDLPYPDTKKAREYLEKFKEEESSLENTHKYETAFVDFSFWLFANADSIYQRDTNVGGGPHSLSISAMVEQLKESPPGDGFRPETFDLETWEDLMARFDTSETGTFIRSDYSRFWGSYGVHASEMGNRKPKKIKSITSKILEIILSLQTLQEEYLLSDESNKVRTCSLDCKYVGTLDFDIEKEDKEFLFRLGEKDTSEWVKKRAAQMQEDGKKKRGLSRLKFWHRTKQIDRLLDAPQKKLSQLEARVREIRSTPQEKPSRLRCRHKANR